MSETGQEVTIIDIHIPAPVPSVFDDLVGKWLTVKCSKSEKTWQAYEMVIHHFREELKKRNLELFSEVRLVSSAADDYVRTSYDRRGRVRNGKLSEGTINQRLAILSSFYEYCKKKHDERVTNPITLCDREKANVHDAAQYIDSETITDILKSMKRDTLQGKRDYALLSLACTTGRRAAELVGLRYGNMQAHGKKLQVTWSCKGNKTMEDILGSRTRAAIDDYLTSLYEGQIIADDAPVFVSLSRNNYGKAMSEQAVSDICKKILGTSKIHSTRHTFSVNLEAAGASLSEISERLGHNSLAVTSEYMKRQHRAENKHIDKLEEMFGI